MTNATWHSMRHSTRKDFGKLSDEELDKESDLEFDETLEKD